MAEYEKYNRKNEQEHFNKTVRKRANDCTGFRKNRQKGLSSFHKVSKKLYGVPLDSKLRGGGGGAKSFQKKKNNINEMHPQS